jgi:hypothetical protein
MGYPLLVFGRQPATAGRLSTLAGRVLFVAAHFLGAVAVDEPWQRQACLELNPIHSHGSQDWYM